MDTAKLKPEDIDVNLTFGGQATISVFDLETMIMPLLIDPTLMQPNNIAKSYDLFTGKCEANNTEDCYGEIHTGDAWKPAQKCFCGDDNPKNMPIALVIFGDKSHLDLHGSLSTLPIIFTLSCFNQESRNKQVEFWRPLAFLPNLSYGALSTKNSKTPTNQSYQDEHDCLHAAFSSLCDLHRNGGTAISVIGRPVVGKIWIHYCVGDSQGNNHWLGHFNGNGNLNHPYQDYNCQIWDMDKPKSNCQYVT
jgi:hypothetical protein